MAVRDGSDPWVAGEVLQAADLNQTFASKLPYSYGTATPSTTDSGFLWYDSNSTPAAPKFWDGAAFQALTSGKILQVVRATDSTDRTITSSSFVDVTGMSVTITPSKSDSAILLLMFANVRFRDSSTGNFAVGYLQITDSSNNAISGATETRFNQGGSASSSATLELQASLLAYATPATTSPVTYKVRARKDALATEVVFYNGTYSAGQLYAIEVSA